MSYRETLAAWLASSALSADEQAELHALDGNDAELESRFYGPLEFGTAGLRGVMGVGINRMNRHVIRHATQAFAQLILQEGAAASKAGVAICFDCRNHSIEFAREAACVMAGNGISVRLFTALRPTPELSFAVRHYGCIAGINVTASHNPKEYNGYKVYWSDGAQLPPQHAAAIAKNMEQLDLFTSIRRMDFDEAQAAGLITLLGVETDKAFLSAVMAMTNDRAVVSRVADRFSMVYTPFHGTGYEQIPYVLRQLGLKKLHCVEEQMKVDGNFSSVPSPNPENPESFALALALAKKEQADFILGSDPDADRVGSWAREHDGSYRFFTGNQTGALLLDYLIGAKRRAGSLPANAVALKTIVTTNLARRIAQSQGVASFDTFTGFKFMAEKKQQLEEAGAGHVIFSYEESFGYMLGDYVRDKDAVTAALLLTEMTAYYFDQGKTLSDALEALYKTHGYHEELTLNLMMPGLSGMANMKALMHRLREAPLTDIAGIRVLKRTDYEDGTQTELSSMQVTKSELCGSNVLRYTLADGTDLLIRPSGTEPKLKVYILAHDTDRAACHARVEALADWAKAELC